jgi:hypothetical protein
MFKRYDKLANYLVNVQESFSGKNDAIALLRRRTKKFNVQRLLKKLTSVRVNPLPQLYFPGASFVFDK